MIRRLVLFTCIAIFVAGCGRSDEVQTPRVPPGDGIVRGVINFVGNPLTSQPINTTSDSSCGDSLPDESIVINPNHTLSNVVVYLENAPQIADVPAEAALLDQRHCQYVPHVLAMQTNQRLKVRSSDATFHNVHFDPENNSAKNFAMTRPGDESEVTFKHADIIRFRCDVHPWMCAWVAVFPHPFFCVTDYQGKFEIARIPRGKYKLIAWQEMLGKKETDIEITGKPLELHLDFLN